MFLNILSVLLILGITFLHSIWGLFSGLIDLFCCLVAMVITFGFFEPLNAFAVAQGLNPSYSLPVCFISLFVVSHLVLRTLADNLIRGNVRVPMYVDWAGGAACGFLIAMISVGMLVMGFFLLPMGGRVMGFSRYDRQEDIGPDGYAVFQRRSVWFKPDEFTAGLFNMLSGGSLKYKVPFASVYPNFAEWVTWTGNTVQPESFTSPPEESGFGSKGLRVLTWWEETGSLNARYRPQLPKKDDFTTEEFTYVDYRPEPGRRLLGVRMTLNQASADADKGTRFHRFRPTMIRMVGTLNGRPKQYFARILGGAESGVSEFRVVDVDNNLAVPATMLDTPVDVFFEVDEGFQPKFVEYRRFARAPITGEPAPERPSDRLVGPETPGQQKMRSVSASRFLAAIIEDKSGERTKLPFPMNRGALGNCELEDGKLKSGRVYGSRARLTGVGTGGVEEFAVPEGRKMFQLCCKARRASSLAGKVFNFVNLVVNQYFVVNIMGEKYPLAGYYAIVNRDGSEYVELYLSDPDDASFRAMLDFKYIDRQELRRDDTIIGFLFFVKPGDTIVRFENQAGQAVLFKVPGYEISP